jgi:hypothetical protein
MPLLPLHGDSAKNRYFSPISSYAVQEFTFLSHLACELLSSLCQDGCSVMMALNHFHLSPFVLC